MSITPPAATLLAITLLEVAAPSAVNPHHPPMHCSAGPSLDVEIEAMKDRTGRIVVELYPATEADFLQDKSKLLKEGKFFRRTAVAAPANGPARVCVSAPAPGTYAMVVIHDRDGRDKFSIGKDGIALPQAQPLGTSRPRVKQASVVFGAAPRSFRVQMQYLHGLKGFASTGKMKSWPEKSAGDAQWKNPAERITRRNHGLRR